MPRIIRSFGAFLMLALLVQTSGAYAQFNNNDDWLNDAFVKPLPGKTKDGDTVTEDKSVSIRALQNFMNNRTFLSAADATQYSKNLESLVGNYFILKKDGVIELSGTTVASDAKSTEIQDGVIFSAIVDRQFNAGVKYLPFLNINMKKNDKASLTLQSVVTVHGSQDVNRATCNIPLRFLGKKDAGIRFITTATVTMIKKKTFKVREQKGSGLISILSLNGRNYYSSDIEERVPVISVSSIPVSPIDPAYQHMCAKYNDAYKNIKVAAIRPKTRVRALRALRSMRLSKEQRAFNKARAELAKVIKKTASGTSNPVGGKVLRIEH